MSINDLEVARQKAVSTYNAAADFFDHPANTFWARYGRRTIEKLALKSGERVLDVCCGSGASAIPAAEMVGPTGSVLGIDLAENLLELARSKAKQQNLTNVQFQSGDITQLSFESESFDAVVCVFGIFFVPDMTSALSELKRVLRHGGKLAITTWGPRLFEPVNTAFWDSVRNFRPDLYKGFNPWDRISEVEDLRSLLAAAGFDGLEIVAESGSQPVNSASDWWAMIMGSGYRGTIEQLTPEARGQVQQQNADFIQRTGLRSIECNVVYATAIKPSA
jgi:ubiquinone/menaquinone biosynthesis C-methylase UbiE